MSASSPVRLCVHFKGVRFEYCIRTHTHTHAISSQAYCTCEDVNDGVEDFDDMSEQKIHLRLDLRMNVFSITASDAQWNTEYLHGIYHGTSISY